MSNDSMQTLKGFRDFFGPQARARLWTISRIREVFELFGFEPLETPALEYAALLTGKYGDEADKLIYTFQDRGGRDVALRYDQTVPTARVISQYRNELPLPYKRYQIQPVWRADKPQKGRYREFTQTDIDILGSSSATADAEILACTYESLKKIGFPAVTILINDRKTLFSGLENYATSTVSIFSIIQTIDKLTKIGEDGVVEELIQKGLSKESASNALSNIQTMSINPELAQIIEYAQNLGIPAANIVFTPTLARGLDYYTGMIFEVILPGYSVGSVAAGGRYDTLIEKLGGTNIPAVGVALGFDRLVDAAFDLNIFPQTLTSQNVLVTVFNEECAPSSLKIATALRKAGISTELYSGTDSLEKQLKYANKKDFQFCVLAGPDEVKNNTVTIKNLPLRSQETVTLDQLIAKLTS